MTSVRRRLPGTPGAIDVKAAAAARIGPREIPPPSVRPGQVIVYNGFKPTMHENWYSRADLEPGHVRHLGLAGG